MRRLHCEALPDVTDERPLVFHAMPYLRLAKGEPPFHGLPAAPQPLPLLATAALTSCQPVRVAV